MSKAVGARATVPVICIGNFTVGGSGKTPVAEALARAALARGLKPGFVLRGFGAIVGEAVIVDPARHTFRDVGDEALMLSETAPAAVSPARADAAALLIETGVDLIIMDDGLQSGKISFDFSVCVVDGARGFGNGFCLPAGPLRAPLGVQFSKTDLVLLNGEGAAIKTIEALAQQHCVAVAHSSTNIVDTITPLSGANVLAYAGIGNPDKFFHTIQDLGAARVEKAPLADHQVITPSLARLLLERADRDNLVLATTAKDCARLLGDSDADLTALRMKSHVVRIEAVFADNTMAERIVDAAISGFRNRHVF